MSADETPGWRNRIARWRGRRGVLFWAGTISAVSVGALLAGSQIARDRGQSVDWYAAFGGWLSALGSFVAAGSALWIATSDRRRSDAERRCLEDQKEDDLRRQAGLVRVTAEMIGRGQAVGPSIRTPAVGIRNRRTGRIFDIEVVRFIHDGVETKLTPEMVNGFNISPPRPNQQGRFYFDSQLKGLVLETDEWLVIYQQDDLPGTPADYAAVRYTDGAGGRWEVDTRGMVARC